MSEAFEQLYECRFWDDDPKSARLREMACAYHERTEAFDRTLDWSVPPPPYWVIVLSPHTQSARHAREVRGELVLLCLEEGISPRRLDAAIRIGARHFSAPAPLTLRPSGSPIAT